MVEEGVREASVGLGNLWSGAAGAFLVALFTVGYTEIGEARQRVRVRMGYARLLEAEIEDNSRLMQMISSVPGVTWKDLAEGYWPESPPTVEAWKEIREPLAALIKPEDFARLTEYYRRIGVFMDQKEHSPKNEKDLPMELTAWGVSNALMSDAPTLRSMLSRYANPPPRTR